MPGFLYPFCTLYPYLHKAQLVFHLNQPGVHQRPAASSPLDLPATATTTHTTTTITTTQASIPVTCTVTRAAAPPAMKLVSPVRPIVADPGQSAPSMPVIKEIGSEPATLDWLQGAFDVDQWLQEERDMSLSTPNMSFCEMVSPQPVKHRSRAAPSQHS